MDTPLVSIVVPVYNSEEYLRQCVDSVLAQTYSRWELILIDDGSTDASPAICRLATRAASRIHTITRSHAGPGAARNAGLRMSDGRYICFIDSDDVIHPRFLELMVRQALLTGADIVDCRKKKFTDDLKLCSSITFDKPFCSLFEKIESNLYTPVAAARRMLYQRRQPDASVCGKLFATSLWRNIRFNEQTLYEDLDVMPRVTLTARLIALYPATLYFYRQHEESILHTFSLKRADVIDVADRLAAHMKENRPEVYAAALSRRLSASFNMLGLMETGIKDMPEEDKTVATEIIARCRSNIKEARLSSLFNPYVRFKNKAAILASYAGGWPLLSFLSRIVYR